MNVKTVRVLLALAGLFGGLIEAFVSLAYWGQTWIYNERLTVLPFGTADRAELAIYHPIFGTVLLTVGLLGVVFAIGAFMGRPWAWWLGIVLYPLNIIFGIIYWMSFTMFRGFTFLSVSGVIMAVVITAVLSTDFGHAALGRAAPKADVTARGGATATAAAVAGTGGLAAVVAKSDFSAAEWATLQGAVQQGMAATLAAGSGGSGFDAADKLGEAAALLRDKAPDKLGAYREFVAGMATAGAEMADKQMSGGAGGALSTAQKSAVSSIESALS